MERQHPPQLMAMVTPPAKVLIDQPPNGTLVHVLQRRAGGPKLDDPARS